MRRPLAPSLLLLATLWVTAAAAKEAAEKAPPRPGKTLILDFEGDSEGRLRAQMEAAVRKSGRVELVPLSDYAHLAEQKGLLLSQAATPDAIKELAPQLGITAVLTGLAGTRITVRILDGFGVPIWSKNLPSVEGRFTTSHSRRLAAALAAAAEGVALKPKLPKESPDPSPPTPIPSNDLPRPQTARSAPRAALVSAPPQPEPAKPVAKPAPPPPPPPPAPAPVAAPVVAAPVVAPDPLVAALPPSAAPAPPSPPRAPLLVTPPGYLDYPLESPEGGAPPPPLAGGVAGGAGPYGKAKKKGKPPSRLVVPHFGPKVFRLELGGLAVFRSYCARPGVTGGCATYDALSPADRPPGPTADFSWQSVYPGGVVSAEVFPLAGAENLFLRGLGVLGGYGRGFSSSLAPSTTAGGSATQVPVSAIDERYWAMIAARVYFGWDDAAPVSGYVGLRAGFVGRGFTPNSPAGVFLPSTRRHMWAVGLDLQIPIRTWIKVELGGLYYLGAGVTDEDAAPLGSQTGWFGVTGWGGISGDFAVGSPFGYFARVQWDHFDEQFGSGGTAWPNGGVAQEVYLTVSAGLSLSF